MSSSELIWIITVTKPELESLVAIGADKFLKEALGPRADDSKQKMQMEQKISLEGYAKLDDLDSDIEYKQTLNVIDAYMTACGINTDLLQGGLALPRTLKNKEKREIGHQRTNSK